MYDMREKKISATTQDFISQDTDAVAIVVAGGNETQAGEYTAIATIDGENEVIACYQ